MKLLLLRSLVLFSAGTLAAVAAGADWRAFRGTDGNPVAADTGVPRTWSDARDSSKNVAWKIELPGRGPSSPIVVGDKVIVTASDGYEESRLHVLACDAATGRTLWHRTFWATGRTFCHPTTANAAPTPTSDGEAVYAFYSSNDLVCVDLDGNFRWFRGLAYDSPKAGNDVGMASSPVVAGDTVIVQVENQGDSFAAGIDKRTGETRWRIERPPTANWSSPILIRDGGGQTAVVLQSTGGLTAVHPETGQVLWTFDTSCAGVPSSVADRGAGRLFAPADGLLALKLAGVDEAPAEQWRSNKLRPGTASPLVYDGRVYTVSGSAILTCGEAATGEVVWQMRLKGPIWSTPVIADRHMYILNGDGLAQVVKLTADRGELVATYDFDTTIQATAAIAGGAYYVRSDQNLWKIAEP